MIRAVREWYVAVCDIANLIGTVWRAEAVELAAAPGIPPGTQVTFEVSTGGLGLTRTKKALNAAFDDWVCLGAPLTFREASGSGGSHLRVAWVDLGKNGSLAKQKAPSGTTSGFIELNSKADWNTVTTFERVVLHEVGNIVGLRDDCNDLESIMCDDGFRLGRPKRITVREKDELKQIYKSAWSPGLCEKKPESFTLAVWSIVKIAGAINRWQARRARTRG